MAAPEIADKTMMCWSNFRNKSPRLTIDTIPSYEKPQVANKGNWKWGISRKRRNRMKTILYDRKNHQGFKIDQE